MLDLHFDIVHFAKIAGYWGLAAIILAETGLFIGFFLPGDSLLFTAGLLASQKVFNIWLLIPLMIICSIVGYALAFWYGDKIGQWLLRKPDRFWFKRRYIIEAHEFYEKHGGKALIIGRLVPIIRTFLPVVAGMAQMAHKRFLFYNVVGGVTWCGGITILGYFLGGVIPNIDTYLLPIIFLIIFLSILPGIIHLLRAKQRSKS